MPYIGPRLRGFAGKNPLNDGELNFAITTLVNSYLEKHGVRYTTLNEVIGVLECAKLELYRRIAAPYEDTKIEENGDVYSVRGEQPTAGDYDICDDLGCPCHDIPVSDNDIGEDNLPLRGDSPSTCPDPHCF